MKRILNPSWQFLLASGLRRGVWLAAPEYCRQEFAMARHFLEGGELPRFDALSDQIAIQCYSDNEDGDASEVGQKNTCAVISMVGTMFRYGTMCSYGADEYAAMLDVVRASNDIQSVVLNIDSGGGDSRAVAPILEAIQRIQETGKPIVASVDACMSAAYFVACRCDKIYAQNTISSSVGSIGTYCELYDDAKQLEIAGLVRHTVYAPSSTDKNKPYKDALKGEYDLLADEILTPLNDTFISTVKAGRSNVSAEVFTGKSYFANDAVSKGLIDGVKTLQEAIRFAQDLAVTRSYINQ